MVNLHAVFKLFVLNKNNTNRLRFEIEDNNEKTKGDFVKLEFQRQ